jgi:putative NADH-flavin reductase
MQLVVFGASGRTGLLTVFQALEKGYHVTAFSRKATSVTIQHKNLEVVEGDILEIEKVRQAIKGQDAVISALGVESRKYTTVLSEGTSNIIRTMNELGVKRIICMSSAGILGNDGGFFFGKIFIPLFLKQVFEDKKRQLKLLQDSNLEWVLIRPVGLTDAPKTGKYQIYDKVPGSSTIPRADVADFMLKLLTDKKYDKMMPAISSR